MVKKWVESRVFPAWNELRKSYVRRLDSKIQLFKKVKNPSTILKIASKPFLVIYTIWATKNVKMYG